MMPRYGEHFPAGSIALPVVRAVELKCIGQSVTLLPEQEDSLMGA